MKRDNSRHHTSFKKIGGNIKAFRERSGLSQEELAFRVGSTRNYIGCIERAEKCPSVAFLLDISKALNIHLKDIFNNI